MPVGRWVIRTAESVVLTLWPPGPLLRKTSMRRSFSSMLDVDRLGLRQHEDAGGAGVHPPLRLGDRDALDAVHAALELQQGVRRLAGLGRPLGLHGDGHRLVARPGRTRSRPGSRPSSRAARRSGCTCAAGRRRTAPTPRRPRRTSPRGSRPCRRRVAGHQQLAQPLLGGRPGARPSASASSAKVGSSAASSRAASTSSPSRCHSRQAPMIDDSSAYRWLSRLASRASAWVSGAASRCSSSACSATQPLHGLEHPAPLSLDHETKGRRPPRVAGTGAWESYFFCSAFLA